MQREAERLRLDSHASMSSRAKDVVLKIIAVMAAAVMLVSAFVLSLAFFAIASAAALAFGGYIWWKTRELRAQIDAALQDRMGAPQTRGNVIEGVVISRSEADANRQNR